MVLIVKVQHSFMISSVFSLFFSVSDREEFNKSFNLICSGSEQNFPMLLLTAGGIVVLN